MDSNQRYLSPYCLTRSRSFRSARHRRLVKPKTAIPIHYDDYTAFEFALGCASTVV